MAALNKIAPNSPSRQHPSELETSIANALYDLESNIPDMRSALRPLQFVSAREVRFSFAVNSYELQWILIILLASCMRVTSGHFTDPTNILDRSRSRQESNRHLRSRSPSARFSQGAATVRSLSSPFPTITSINAKPLPITSLTRELEKKFSDRHVLILASRRILPRPKRSNRSRTSQTQKRPRSRTLTAVHDAILTDLVYPVEIVGKRTRTREDGSKVLKVVLDEKERGGVDYRLDTYSEIYRKLTGRGVGFEFPQGGPAEY